MRAQGEVTRAKEETISVIRTEGKFHKQNRYEGAMILRRGIQEMAFEPLNWSSETFLTSLFRTNERNEKSRSVFKKPRCHKDESDGCIDTWIEVIKLHFEEEDLSERQECSALTSDLEGLALNCLMAKKQYQRDTAEKIFEIL